MVKKQFMTSLISSLVLVSFIGCDLSLITEGKSSYLDENVTTVVSKVIDEQMEFVKPNLEPDLQAELENTKGSSTLSGNEIITLTLTEDSGEDYIDFCYNVQESTFSGTSENVLESARNVMTEQQYLDLTLRVEEAEKKLEDWGESYVKGLPADQQHDFYKDLKTLVTRTTVLLTAGIVYAVMPKAVFWGKVSAASAISVGAGLVALTAMTIYEKYKFNDEESASLLPDGDKVTIEDWLKELVKEPKADFALTTAVVSLATTLKQGPVVTGIMICVFGILQATDLISAMLKKYDFKL